MIDFKYLENLPFGLVELYAEVETDILNDMAERINAMDYYLPAVQWQEQKLQQMGLTHQDIVRKLSGLTGKTEAELGKLINNAGAQVLASNPFIEGTYNWITTSPLWQARLKAGLSKTSQLFENLTKTTAYCATNDFQHALDRAYMQIESGAFSRTEAVRNAVKDLSGKGLRTVSYFDMNTGELRHTDNVDVAVRRAVLTGINQTTAELQLTVCQELELDLVEVSAHAGARPSHAEWQGRIYSVSGKSTKYPDFRSATGYGTGEGLCGWNCRHTFYPWAEGSSRVWSDQQLAKLEEKTVEYNGKKYTEYEASQIQRGLEREVRKWKREASALKSAGQPNQAELDRASMYNSKLNDFCNQTGFKKQYDRTVVYDGQIPVVKQPPKVASKATTPPAPSATVKPKIQPAVTQPAKATQATAQATAQAAQQAYKVTNYDPDSDYSKLVTKVYNDAPEDFRKVWEKHIPSGGKLTDPKANGAWCNGSGDVYLNVANDMSNPRGNGVTYFHEHGHALDILSGDPSLKDEFLKALKKDYDNALNRVGVAGDTKADKQFKLSMELYKKPDTYNGVSDTFDGLSKGKARGKWGHPSSYWKNDKTNANREAWAHMVEGVFFEGQRTAMQEYFPTAWKAFNDIIATL